MLTKTTLPVVTHRPNSLESLEAGFLVTLTETNYAELQDYVSKHFGLVIRKFIRKDRNTGEDVTSVSICPAHVTDREEQRRVAYRGRQLTNIMFSLNGNVLEVMNVHDAMRYDKQKNKLVRAQEVTRHFDAVA